MGSIDMGLWYLVFLTRKWVIIMVLEGDFTKVSPYLYVILGFDCIFQT